MYTCHQHPFLSIWLRLQDLNTPVPQNGHGDIFEEVQCFFLCPYRGTAFLHACSPTWGITSSNKLRTRYALETRYRGRDKFFRVAQRAEGGWVYLLSENYTAARKDKYLIPCFAGDCFSLGRSLFRFINRTASFIRQVSLIASMTFSQHLISGLFRRFSAFPLPRLARRWRSQFCTIIAVKWLKLLQALRNGAHMNYILGL